MWRVDLDKLHDRGYVSGMSFDTEYEHVLAWWEGHKDVLSDSDNRPITLPRPDPKDYLDDRPNIAVIAPEGMSLTHQGLREIVQMSRSVDAMWPAVGDRVKPILAISYFDTAVREACIILETRIREILGTRDYGQDLVEKYVASVVFRFGARLDAFLRVLRGEVRTVFKFIRNEYAHSLHEITEAQCLSFLTRISQILERIDEIEQAILAGHK
jgi:hypothetical protein